MRPRENTSPPGSALAVRRAGGRAGCHVGEGLVDVGYTCCPGRARCCSRGRGRGSSSRGRALPRRRRPRRRSPRASRQPGVRRRREQWGDVPERLHRAVQLATPVDLTGWTVEYASSTGTTWQKTPLAGTIAPGQYYLVQGRRVPAGPSTCRPRTRSGRSRCRRPPARSRSSARRRAHLPCPTGWSTSSVRRGQLLRDEPRPNSHEYDRGPAQPRRCTHTDNNSADFTAGTPNPRKTPLTESCARHHL